MPKWFPEHPRQRTGHTEVVSNDRGHLLPGVPRLHESPWGDYEGTWHMPKRITKEVANQLCHPNKNRESAWTRSLEQYRSLNSPKDPVQAAAKARKLKKLEKETTLDAKSASVSKDEGERHSHTSVASSVAAAADDNEECICEPLEVCVCEHKSSVSSKGSINAENKSSVHSSIEPEVKAPLCPIHGI